MTRSGKIMFVASVAALLSYAAIPLSTFANSTSMYRSGEISIDFNTQRMVGLKIISHEVEEGSGVTYNEGAYSATMKGGEKIENFGKTTFQIICNTAGDNTKEPNCQKDGFVLNAVSEKVNSSQAVLVANAGRSFIRSSSALGGDDSTWGMSIEVGRGVPVEMYDPEEDKNVTVIPSPDDIPDTSVPLPEVTGGYEEFHTIPSTESGIVTGNTFKTWTETIVDEEGESKEVERLIYANDFTAAITYGVKVSEYQAAGTYTGAVIYTVAIGSK